MKILKNRDLDIASGCIILAPAIFILADKSLALFIIPIQVLVGMWYISKDRQYKKED
jgi:hypothetical protein